MIAKEHEKYMKEALKLADLGKGFVNPNPLVGAIIVKDGKIIGRGYHECFGQAHAEVNAFLNATEDVEGADMYVTLEPCSHYGKTPPCALKIIEKKIKRVFISQLDPNPLVNHQGVDLLEKAGIEVHYGILEEESKKQNDIFLSYIQTKKPFVAIKYAMTLDGKIATATRDSKWITNEESREFVHMLRNQYMAIMVGVNTIIYDNPKLNTRISNQKTRDPIRLIIDPNLDTPLTSYVVTTAHTQATRIITDEKEHQKIHAYQEKGVSVIQRKMPLNFEEFLKDLGEQKIDSILIEGGSYLHGSILESGVVDKVYAFIAPKIIGGKDALTPIGGHGVSFMKDAYQLENITLHRFQDDLCIEGYIKKQGDT